MSIQAMCPLCPPDANQWNFVDEADYEKHTKEHRDGSRLSFFNMDLGETRTTSSTGGQKGVKPERFDLIPTGPLTELSRLYAVGARKYAEHNWRKGYEWSNSYASIQRHSNLFWGGEDYDICHDNEEGCITVHPETGESTIFMTLNGRGCYNHTAQHHMTCVAFHSLVLLEFKDTHRDFDDRYKGEI